MRIATNKMQKRDIHWHVDDEEYEYLSRSAHNKGFKVLTKLHRERMLPANWQKELIRLRVIHRKSGIADRFFWHPKKISGR